MNPLQISPLTGLALTASIFTTSTFAAVSIDYALVGNASNANDASGYDGVADSYQIAKNETTLSQYAEFLHAQRPDDRHHHEKLRSDCLDSE